MYKKDLQVHHQWKMNSLARLLCKYAVLTIYKASIDDPPDGNLIFREPVTRKKYRFDFDLLVLLRLKELTHIISLRTNELEVIFLPRWSNELSSPFCSFTTRFETRETIAWRFNVEWRYTR